MATVEEIIRKLNKEYNDDKLITKANITPDYERLSTGSVSMDYPLGGGLPLGRICVYSGLAHSGKTTASCLALGAYQHRYPDRPCFYIDVEHSLDLKFQAKMNGLNLSTLNYINPNGLSGEQILDLVIELQKADNVGMIIIDSLPAMLPAIAMETDMTKDNGLRGNISKALYRFLNIMTGMLTEKNNILILINQVRQVGTTFQGAPIYREPCGQAPIYFSSVSVRFGPRKWTKEEDMDACKSTNGEGADGFILSARVTKNKTFSCTRGGGTICYRYATGHDWIHDLLSVALTFDFIHRINNVTYELVDLETGEVYKDADGNDLRGKKSDLIEYIKSNVGFQNKYLAMLNKYISKSDESYGELLDERTKAEIDAQQQAIDNQYGANK